MSSPSKSQKATMKSSTVLEEALKRIEDGSQSYACAAIQDVETDMRYANNNRDVKTRATLIWMRFKPKCVDESMKLMQAWWPKKDPARIDALNKAIAQAKKAND